MSKGAEQTTANKEAKVVEIIPIVRGLPKATLSYFTTETPELGSFVRVPLRSGEALGIVSSISDAKSVRSKLRGAEFSLKKIAAPKKGGGLSPAFITAAEKTARFYAATTGSVLGAVVSKFFLGEPELLRMKISDRGPHDSLAPLGKHFLKSEPLLMQAEASERYSRYFGLVREAFARKSSVLFIVPTKEDGERAKKELSKGIEDFTFFFSSGEKPAHLKELVLNAKKVSHPILFITTPLGLAFDRPDFGLVVLERENSRAYRTLSRPFIDFRYFIRAYTEAADRTLILGDSVLSLETLWKESDREHPDLLPLKWRVPTEAETTLVDMKSKTTKEFKVFSDELVHMMRRAERSNGKVFLFGARKGLAPSTVCLDCGSILGCENCGAPLVLHEKGGVRVYICKACGSKRAPETICDNCKSWRLEALGIGTDRIALEATKLFPNTPVFILDKDHADTLTKQKTLVKKIKLSDRAIIVGTELAFSHLDRIPYVGLVSVDALFSVPDFRINERIFSIIIRLRELAEQELIVQTRNIGKDVLDFALRGNVADFYKGEIKDREAFSYPPFSVFITVTCSTTASTLEKHAAELNKSFAFRRPEFLKLRGQKGKTDLRMIFRLSHEEWPDAHLIRELLLLPPEFSIKVDPESIL